MTLPRALVGPVMGMARPRRPASEVQAVRDAATAIRAEMGLTSAKALGREIALRVIATLLDDAQTDPTALITNVADSNPISKLAFNQEDAAVDELAVQFRDRMLAVFGTHIPPIFQQEVQRRFCAKGLCRALAGRYSRQLREKQSI